MAAKRPAPALLNALDNEQAQEPPPPAKKLRGRPRGSVTKRKSGKSQFNHATEQFDLHEFALSRRRCR